MLLYDRMLELGSGLYKRKALGPDGVGFLAMLHKSTVFEVSNVFPLLGDWEIEKNKGVPRNPPCDLTWVEWLDDSKEDSEPFQSNIRIGLSIAPAGIAGELSGTVLDDPLIKNLQAESLYLISSYGNQEWVETEKFIKECSNNGVPPHAAKIAIRNMRQVVLQGPSWCMAIRKNLTCEIVGWTMKEHPWGISTIDAELARLHYYSPEVAFMAFSLIHCKNIFVDEVQADEKTQRRAVKSGALPRVTYRILKIEVPKTATGRELNLGIGEESGPKMRFHLCSGHFKNLQHSRFVNKGWHWWPAHWRGSRSLGKVVKTYQLESTSIPTP